MAEYNTDEVCLRESIESILNQTFKDFEFIIVDDGTSNNLEAIIADFDDERIRLLKNPSNRGFVYSLNNAIKNARGDYIVRMDTDDRALPERLQRIYHFIAQHPEYDVVGSRAVEFSGSGNGKGSVLGRSGEKTRRNIMRGDTMVHPTVIFRRKAIVDAGLYDTFHRAEDLALWCKLLMRGSRLYVMNDILLEYRVTDQDYKKRVLKNRRGEIRARLHYYPKLRANPIDYLFIVKSIIAGVLPRRLVIIYRKRFVLTTHKEK
jgi:glycosyltransferase involved in cell wall biosynthesis